MVGNGRFREFRNIRDSFLGRRLDTFDDIEFRFSRSPYTWDIRHSRPQCVVHRGVTNNGFDHSGDDELLLHNNILKLNFEPVLVTANELLLELDHDFDNSNHRQLTISSLNGHSESKQNIGSRRQSGETTYGEAILRGREDPISALSLADFRSILLRGAVERISMVFVTPAIAVAGTTTLKFRSP